MDPAEVQAHVTEELLQKLAETRFLHVGLMNRIEGRIRTRDQLERYVGVLVEKLKATGYRSETLVDRIDRNVALLERLDRQSDGHRQTA